MNKESYGLPEDNFSGDDVCVGCRKLDVNLFCTAYSTDGSVFRQKEGYCPVVNRWADWRKDKPVEVGGKKRVGQGKTKQGGNR